MQRLSHIQIQNYRSSKDCSFPLDDFTPLVGYNNGGKSNILSAIKWLLKPSALPAGDFNDPTKPVIVSGTVEGITDDVLSRLLDKHRKAIEPYCASNALRIQQTQESPGGGARALALKVRDPSVSEEGSEDAWKPNPAGIQPAIKALFPAPIEIGAMENVPDDVAKAKSGTTIQNLVNEIVKPITDAHGTGLQDALDDIGKKLTAEGSDRAEELNTFDEGANEKLHEIFPGLRLKLHVPPPTLPDLFKNGTIKVFEEGSDEQRDVSALGHGAQRSVQMALVRHLAEIKAGAEAAASRTMLLIDEPELYLHPQGVEQVRAALRALSAKGYQVVFSTHSPLLIHQDEVASTVVVRKTLDEGTHTLLPLRQAIESVVSDAPSQTRTLFEFGNAAEVFFSDIVLIAEGTTERALLPDIFEALQGKTMRQCRIGLVGLGGSGSIAKSLKILNAIGLKAKALADLDFAFKTAPENGLLESDDSDVKSGRDLFGSLAPKHGIALGDDGFPKKNEEITASEAFALFARDTEGARIAKSLHEKMQKHGIWLWAAGAIEHHLGIAGKGESSWADYRRRLKEESPGDVISNQSLVRDFLRWLCS